MGNIPEEPTVRLLLPVLFSEFWEELGRTKARGRENLDVARTVNCYLVPGQVHFPEVISTYPLELCMWGRSTNPARSHPVA